MNITPDSRVTSIRVGINQLGYLHILSFRKQMYVQPEEVEKLLNSLQITYDDTNYWTYFSIEKLTFYTYDEEGHLARYCKNTDQNVSHSTQAKSINRMKS